MSDTHHPFIIGLTGNIATGKSTILSYLAGKGAHVIDADRLAHRTMAPDGLAYIAIVKAFGREILNADGVIDRSALGKIVFNDPAALQILEQIVHPAVFQLAQQEMAMTHALVVVIEAIKLLEAQRLSKLCDEIWVVTASPESQLRRLREKRGVDEAEARKRMAAQSSEAEKLKQADRVIHNDGAVEQLYEQLDTIWAEIEKRWTN
jgi:dephospho-CoA kinase